MGNRLQMLVRGGSDPEENGKGCEVLFFFFSWAGVVQAKGTSSSTVERKDGKAQEEQRPLGVPASRQILPIFILLNPQKIFIFR